MKELAKGGVKKLGQREGEAVDQRKGETVRQRVKFSLREMPLLVTCICRGRCGCCYNNHASSQVESKLALALLFYFHGMCIVAWLRVSLGGGGDRAVLR